MSPFLFSIPAASLLHGCTIHKWAGLGDGRYSAKDIFSKMEIEHQQEIKRTQVLVVDEISMMSSATFQKIEEVIRFVRGGILPFGGLQVVLCGDMFQVLVYIVV